MQFVTVSSDRAAVIAKQTGIYFTYVDKSLRGVRIPIGDSFIDIRLENYSVTVTEPAPPEMVKVAHLLGLVAGFAVDERFSEEREAEDRISGFQVRVDVEHVQLAIEIIETTREEADELLATGPPTQAPINKAIDLNEDIPF